MRSLLIYTFFLSTFYIYGQSTLNSSLTACYALDGSANEPINNLNGILGAVTPTVDRFNNANSAYAFNGSAASIITLPNNTLIKPNAISFSAWVKTNTLASQYLVFTTNGCGQYFEGYIFAIHNPGNGTRFHLAKSYTCTSTQQVSLNSSLTVSTGTWYHVGFYAGPDSLKIYVNGNLNAFIAYATNLTYSSSGNVYFGGTGGGNNLAFNGTLDNVRFYNRKLSDAEFNQLYTQDPSCLAPLFPVASFSISPTNICAGSSFSLTDLSTNNPNAWNWQVAGATTNSSSSNNPVLNLSTPGNYTLSLVSTNTLGASNTATQVITIHPNPTITISSPGTFCAGQTGTLSASGANTYSWSSGQSGSSIVVGPNNINSSYSVVGTSAFGCTGSALQSITINTVLPTISISGSGTICQGLPTTLLANGSAITFTWSNGSVGNLITVTPSVSNVYTVIGTGVSGCTASATQLVFVNSVPAVAINANNNSVCLGDPVILNANGAVTYSWSGGVVNNVAFYPSTTASYSVVGTGTNSCKNSANIQIVVNPLPVLTHSILTAMPICAGEAITLSAGGANIYNWSNGTTLPTAIVNPTIASSYTVTGTDANGCNDSHVFILAVEPCTSLKENNSNASVSIFPNPNHGQFVIKGLIGEYKSLKVLNLLAEVILQKDLSTQSSEMPINIESQPKGIYFIILSNETSDKTVKFIKE